MAEFIFDDVSPTAPIEDAAEPARITALRAVHTYYPKKATYVTDLGTVLSGAANQLLGYLFNSAGSGRILKIRKVKITNRPGGVLTGGSISIQMARQNTQPTGGIDVDIVPVDIDTTQALSGVVAKRDPSVTGSSGTPLRWWGAISTEESVTANVLTDILYENDGSGPSEQITVREGKGILFELGPLAFADLDSFVSILVEFTSE